MPGRTLSDEEISRSSGRNARHQVTDAEMSQARDKFHLIRNLYEEYFDRLAFDRNRYIERHLTLEDLRTSITTLKAEAVQAAAEQDFDLRFATNIWDYCAEMRWERANNYTGAGWALPKKRMAMTESSGGARLAELLLSAHDESEIETPDALPTS
ncbi:hypothetical protein JCM3766R1_003957 [Sporobolomyces carnicolor]